MDKKRSTRTRRKKTVKLKGRHWTRTLFVHHPDLFLPWMEQMNDVALEQVDGLQKIFAKHEVPESGRILDVASGLGRISIGLAKAGYDVVGIDISPLYLRLAKRWAEREGLADKTRFYRVDAREGSNLAALRKNKFDAVTIIGTSIGFFGRNADLKMLRGLSKIANAKAILVIEGANRDYIVKHFQGQSVSERDGIVWHEDRKLDLESSFMNNRWKFYRSLGRSLQLVAEIPISHRVYSIHELIELVDSAGWKYLESFGSLGQLSDVTTDTFHITLVARNSSASN